MRIPFYNADPELQRAVGAALEELMRTDGGKAEGSDGAELFHMVPLSDRDQAIEFINYDMPPLIFINFTAGGEEGFEFIDRIVADPWLNNGAVVAFYDRFETMERIGELQNTNIVISLHVPDVPRHFPQVMRVIRDNQQILFQRAFQQDFLSGISGNYTLAMDVVTVSVCANLIANYLYNMGFVEGQAKAAVSLCLTEMLVNAIEHGNCGITAAEKKAHLEAGHTIQGLIDARMRDPAIAARKVHFTYEIQREHSAFTIRDEGKGFDWRPLLAPDREMDFFAEQGRGILLTRSHVEGLAYNECGNEVRFRVPHRLNTTNTVPEAFREHETVDVQPGDVVFNQGEESNFLYYVAEGSYRVEVNGHQVASVDPSDILVGEMSFLLQDRRSATVIADTPGKLIRISKEAFVHSLKNQPYYGLFLAKLLAKRLMRSSQRISQ